MFTLAYLLTYFHTRFMPDGVKLSPNWLVVFSAATSLFGTKEVAKFAADLLFLIAMDVFVIVVFAVSFTASSYLLSVVGISGLALVVISLGVIVFDPQRRRDYEYFEPPYEEPSFPKWDAKMKREMAESKG